MVCGECAPSFVCCDALDNWEPSEPANQIFDAYSHGGAVWLAFVEDLECACEHVIISFDSGGVGAVVRKVWLCFLVA